VSNPVARPTLKLLSSILRKVWAHLETLEVIFETKMSLNFLGSGLWRLCHAEICTAMLRLSVDESFRSVVKNLCLICHFDLLIKLFLLFRLSPVLQFVQFVTVVWPPIIDVLVWQKARASSRWAWSRGYVFFAYSVPSANIWALQLDLLRHCPGQVSCAHLQQLFSSCQRCVVWDVG